MNEIRGESKSLSICFGANTTLVHCVQSATSNALLPSASIGVSYPTWAVEAETFVAYCMPCLTSASLHILNVLNPASCLVVNSTTKTEEVYLVDTNKSIFQINFVVNFIFSRFLNA